jgi:tetratricopeptide (TPR) repeat protein
VTNPAVLYELAASCYQQAGYAERAASCLEAAGLSATAAERYEQAGDLAAAARCYRAGRRPADAERCYLALGEPEQAAATWEEAGSLGQAAFVLALWSRRFEHARWLATEAMPGQPGPARPGPAQAGSAELHRLRLLAIMALCDARATGDSSSLAEALLAIELALPGWPPGDRVLSESFCRTAADAVGRHDLAARVLAASHRAGTPGAGARWRAWADDVLGGTTGIPAGVGATPLASLTPLVPLPAGTSADGGG